MITQTQASVDTVGASQMLQTHPATYGGAQAGARSTSKEFLGNGKVPKEGTKARKKHDARRGCEKATIALWFAQHADAFKQHVVTASAKDGPVTDAKPDAKMIKDFVKQKLTEFLKGAPR